MSYLGDFALTKTVPCRFNTRKADGTPVTLTGGTISVYKNNTTETTTGVTLTTDYDSRTGLQSVVVDTSADGTFYAAGNDFDIVITAGTVDGVSVVGTIVGSFSLQNRSALRPTTAGNTLDVSATGEAGVDWANVGGQSTTVALSGTTVGIATALGANAISNAAIAVDSGLKPIRSNTCGTGSTTTAVVLDASASSLSSVYIGQMLSITGGTGTDQSRLITAYDKTTKIATVTPALRSAPTNTSTYSITAWCATDMAMWGGTVIATPATAGIPEINVKNVNNISASPVTTVKPVIGLTTADTIITYTGNTPQTGDSFSLIGATGSGLTSLAQASGVSVTKWNGTNVANPATAGIPEVNVKNINNHSTSAVTTISAVIGTNIGITFADTGAVVASTISFYVLGNATEYLVSNDNEVSPIPIDFIANTDVPSSSRASAASVAALPTAAQNASTLLSSGDIDGFSLEETLKLCLSALAAKLSGATGGATTIVIRAADDSKNRITALVDANGNRSTVTLDAAG